MARNLRKEIYGRIRFRNKFCKNPTRKNEKLSEKQRNKCVGLRKKCMKKCFHNITDNNINTNKQILNLYKTFSCK